MSETVDPRYWNIAWDEVARAVFIVAIAILAAMLIYRLVLHLMHQTDENSGSRINPLHIKGIRAPLIGLAIATMTGLMARESGMIADFWNIAAPFIVPALIGWLALAIVRGGTAAMISRLDDDDPVAMRGRKTRLAILSNTVSFVIIIVTIGLILIGIPGVREIGVTVMASAGFAALILGAAAQPALRSLIAGIQMALTEPVRIGDMVVVDGHTGRVEETRMSFVLIRCWDERLVVVPTTRFLDGSFENWSRRTEALTGAVFLHLDPITDVAPIRAEFERWVGTHALWDQRTATLEMTDAHAETIELRLSVSAPTIANLWTLRCELREHMLAWLRENQPEALIRHRLEVDTANQRAGGTA